MEGPQLERTIQNNIYNELFRKFNLLIVTHTRNLFYSKLIWNFELREQDLFAVASPVPWLPFLALSIA